MVGRASTRFDPTERQRPKIELLRCVNEECSLESMGEISDLATFVLKSHGVRRCANAPVLYWWTDG